MRKSETDARPVDGQQRAQRGKRDRQQHHDLARAVTTAPIQITVHRCCIICLPPSLSPCSLIFLFHLILSVSYQCLSTRYLTFYQSSRKNSLSQLKVHSQDKESWCEE